MIVIDQADVANTCAGQVKSGRRSKTTCANDQRVRLRDPLLAFNAPLV
jgi:hypothetical protein